jgi:hypothetical protein
MDKTFYEEEKKLLISVLIRIKSDPNFYIQYRSQNIFSLILDPFSLSMFKQIQKDAASIVNCLIIAVDLPSLRISCMRAVQPGGNPGALTLGPSS